MRSSYFGRSPPLFRRLRLHYFLVILLCSRAYLALHQNGNKALQSRQVSVLDSASHSDKRTPLLLSKKWLRWAPLIIPYMANIWGNRKSGECYCPALKPPARFFNGWPAKAYRQLTSGMMVTGSSFRFPPARQSRSYILGFITILIPWKKARSYGLLDIQYLWISTGIFNWFSLQHGFLRSGHSIRPSLTTLQCPPSKMNITNLGQWVIRLVTTESHPHVSRICTTLEIIMEKL